MDMWATHSIRMVYFVFPQSTIKYNFFEKYFNFVLKIPSHKCWVVIQQITPFLITYILKFLVL